MFQYIFKVRVKVSRQYLSFAKKNIDIINTYIINHSLNQLHLRMQCAAEHYSKNIQGHTSICDLETKIDAALILSALVT